MASEMFGDHNKDTVRHIARQLSVVRSEKSFAFIQSFDHRICYEWRTLGYCYRRNRLEQKNTGRGCSFTHPEEWKVSRARVCMYGYSLH